ncbi:MAG: hypothetical protein M3Q71_12130 [Chloroflexota bacterium]|nr:hypothetical protein [Chloroflexota bacterium]
MREIAIEVGVSHETVRVILQSPVAGGAGTSVASAEFPAGPDAKTT